MNVAVDVTALAQTRAGTARYLHGLLPRLEREVALRRLTDSPPAGPGRSGSTWRGTRTCFRTAPAAPTSCTARRTAALSVEAPFRSS